MNFGCLASFSIRAGLCSECKIYGASGKTSASGSGGMGFKFQADQISHTLPTTRHCCNLDVWALAQSRGDEHCSLVTPERVISEYNKDLIKKLL